MVRELCAGGRQRALKVCEPWFLGTPPASMPVPTDSYHSILYLNYSMSRSGSEPNVKDGVATDPNLSDAVGDRSVIMPVQTQIKTDIHRSCST